MVATVGRLFFPPILIIFGFVMSRNEKVVKNVLFHMLIYIPSLLLLFIEILGHPFVSSYIFKGGGFWVPVIKPNLLTILFYMYIFFAAFFSFALILIFRHKTTSIREKKQTGLVLVGATTTIFFAMILDVILPISGNSLLPLLAPVYCVSWMIFIVIAILRYDLLSIDSSIDIYNLVNSMNDFFILVDREGRILKVNSSLKNSLGIDSDRLINKHYSSLIVENIHNEILYTKKDLLYDKEFLINMGSSGQILVKLSKSRIRNKNSKTIGFVFILHRIDIQKELDIEKERLEEKDNEITKARNEFEILSENSIEGFLLLSPQYEVISYNRSAKSIMSLLYNFQLVKGAKLYELFSSKLDEDDFFYLLGSAKDGEIISEKSYTDTNGEVFYYRLNFLPVLTNNILSSIMVMIIDLSDMRRDEKKIRKMYEIEKEVSDMRKQFIHIVSHEFRTPLGGIQGSVELLERYYDKFDETKRKTTFDHIYESISYITRLLEDVVLYGKKEKFIHNPTLVNFEDICKEVIEELYTIQKIEKMINFTVNFEIGMVLLDKPLIKIVISNLLSNGIKYSPPEKNVDLTVSRLSKETFFILVRDYGMGIPDSDLADIFEPFKRGNNVGTIKGTGLGLAIIKKIVDSNGGTVEIESEVGVGTTVIVLLPYISE